MNTAARLSVYGAVLALLTAGAYATGSAVGPFSSAAPTVATGAEHAELSGAEDAGRGDNHGGAVTEVVDQPAGPASSRGGYTLTPTTPTFTAGTATDFSSRDGAPVTDLEPYLLFLDFQHAGAVRTAEFTLPTTAGGAPARSPGITERSGYEHDAQNGHR